MALFGYYSVMSKTTKAIVIIIVAVVAAAGFGFYLTRGSDDVSETSASTSNSPVGGGRMRGPENAPVTLTEDGDYQCPMCGYYAPILLEVLHRFPTQLRLEFHHFPLAGIHQ